LEALHLRCIAAAEKCAEMAAKAHAERVSRSSKRAGNSRAKPSVSTTATARKPGLAEPVHKTISTVSDHFRLQRPFGDHVAWSVESVAKDSRTAPYLARALGKPLVITAGLALDNLVRLKVQLNRLGDLWKRGLDPANQPRSSVIQRHGARQVLLGAGLDQPGAKTGRALRSDRRPGCLAPFQDQQRRRPTHVESVPADV
jgi:hypothetical protein